jgi:hypothetical protein
MNTFKHSGASGIEHANFSAKQTLRTTGTTNIGYHIFSSMHFPCNSFDHAASNERTYLNLYAVQTFPAFFKVPIFL